MTSTKRETIHVVSGDTISKQQIIRILRKAMPCADVEDVSPFAMMLTDGEDSTTIGNLLMNVFINTSVPYASTS